MFERDYVMRMAKQLAAALGRVMTLRQKRDDAAAQSELGEASKTLFGVEPEALRVMPLVAVIDMFRGPTGLDGERVAMAARLLKEYGEVREDQGADARGYFERALALFDAVDTKEHAEAIEPYREDIEEMRGEMV